MLSTYESHFSVLVAAVEPRLLLVPLLGQQLPRLQHRWASRVSLMGVSRSRIGVLRRLELRRTRNEFRVSITEQRQRDFAIAPRTNAGPAGILQSVVSSKNHIPRHSERTTLMAHVKHRSAGQ